MGSKIGYPAKILNLTQLDLDFKEVCVCFYYKLSAPHLKCRFPQLHIDNGHILFNVIRMRRHEVWREIQKVFQPPSKDRYAVKVM